MRLRIVAIGKPKLAFAKSGIAEYVERLRPVASLQVDYVKAGSPSLESETLLDRSTGAFRVALDERGEQISSRDLASRITRWEHAPGLKEVCFLVGGANGHSDMIRQQADWLWSLGSLTLQHELALVVVLEQIYRAYSLKTGSPYHRD
jgi:23S rRNA (pseudouridine1915-N3)-methyltransferase